MASLERLNEITKDRSEKSQIYGFTPNSRQSSALDLRSMSSKMILNIRDSQKLLAPAENYIKNSSRKSSVGGVGNNYSTVNVQSVELS